MYVKTGEWGVGGGGLTNGDDERGEGVASNNPAVVHEILGCNFAAW